jgi:lysophospholipase L1-like esterase
MMKLKRTMNILVALTLAVFLLSGTCVFATAKKDVLYVALGDSIAAGTGMRNAEKACYGAIVANTNSYTFVNHAVLGHKTVDLLGVLARDDVRADLKKADVISISIGGNDFLNGGMYRMLFDARVRGNYAWMDRLLATFRENFLEVVAQIKVLNPTALLLVQTLYNPKQGSQRAIYQKGLDGINGVFRQYLAAHPGSYEIVDVAPVIESDKDLLALDNVHPSAKGHVAIAEAYLRSLKNLGYGTATRAVLIEEGSDIKGTSFLTVFFFLPLIFTFTSIATIFVR